MYMYLILQIPDVKDTKDFISAWGKFMQEVTEVMLEITAHGHTSETIKRLVEIDERIWDWTLHVCVHQPSTVRRAQDVSMQTGEPQQMSIEFWVKVVAKLNLTEDQVGGLRSTSTLSFFY